MTPAEERIAFYRELGVALAQWAQVERSLYLVVSLRFPQSHRHLLGIGFVAIEGFRSKLLFADRAITRALIGGKYADDWPPLMDRLATQSGLRNKLAHNQAIDFPQSPAGRRLALCPWIAPKGIDKSRPPPKSLCIRDIIKVRMEFENLTLDLRNFAARVDEQPEPFPKSAGRPMHPPTIRQIARQIHEELGHPRKSLREKRREESERNAAASLK